MGSSSSATESGKRASTGCRTATSGSSGAYGHGPGHIRHPRRGIHPQAASNPHPTDHYRTPTRLLKYPDTTRTPRCRPTGPLSGTALRRWDPGPSDRGHTKVIRESYGIHTPRSSLANHGPAGPDPRPKASQTAERMRNPCHAAPCTRARKPRRRSIFFTPDQSLATRAGPFGQPPHFALSSRASDRYTRQRRCGRVVEGAPLLRE